MRGIPISISIPTDVTDIGHDLNTNLQDLQGTIRDGVHDANETAREFNTNLRELQDTLRDGVHQTNETARALVSEANQTMNDRTEQALNIVDRRTGQVIDAVGHNVTNLIDAFNVQGQQLVEATGARAQESLQIVGREVDHGINVVQEGIQGTNETFRRGVSVAANIATTARVATVAGAAVAGAATYSHLQWENEQNALRTETMRLQSLHYRVFVEADIERVRGTQEARSAISHFWSVIAPTIERSRAHIAIKCSDQAMVSIFRQILSANEIIRGQIGHLAVGVSLQSMIDAMEEALPDDDGEQGEGTVFKAFLFLVSTGTTARRPMELHEAVTIGPRFTRYGTFVGETTDSEPRHALNALSTLMLQGNEAERLYLASDASLYSLLCTTSTRCPIYVNGSDWITIANYILTGPSRDVAGDSRFKAGCMSIMKLTTATLSGKLVKFAWNRTYTYLIVITGTRAGPYKQVLTLSLGSREELKRLTNRTFYYE